MEVKWLENFLNLFFCVRLAELSSGEMQKGFENQASSMSSIEIIDDFLDKFIAGSKPEAGKRIFEL